MMSMDEFKRGRNIFSLDTTSDKIFTDYELIDKRTKDDYNKIVLYTKVNNQNCNLLKICLNLNSISSGVGYHILLFPCQLNEETNILKQKPSISSMIHSQQESDRLKYIKPFIDKIIGHQTDNFLLNESKTGNQVEIKFLNLDPNISYKYISLKFGGKNDYINEIYSYLKTKINNKTK